MAAWVYGVANTTSNDSYDWLDWALLVAQPLAGFLVARWWAILLPLVVVAVSVPAGYPPITPENAEPFPIWFSLAVVAVVAIPLVTAGVVARKVYARRTRTRVST
jgi:hypothetical protein